MSPNTGVETAGVQRIQPFEPDDLPASFRHPADTGIDLLEGVHGPFFHTDNIETLNLIAETRVLRGSPPRNFFRSEIPAAKAHVGNLPEGVQGVEFYTLRRPDFNNSKLGLGDGTRGHVFWNGKEYTEFEEIKIIPIRTSVTKK